MNQSRGQGTDPAGRASSPRLLVAAGLVWIGEQRLLVQRRASTAAHGAGCLEFPGGKIERGESPARALARELIEEWGPAAAELEVGRVADVVHHVYPPPGPEVILIVLHVDGRAWAGGRWKTSIEVEAGASVESHPAADLPTDRFLEADRELITRLRTSDLRPQR